MWGAEAGLACTTRPMLAVIKSVEGPHLLGHYQTPFEEIRWSAPGSSRYRSEVCWTRRALRLTLRLEMIPIPI